MIHHAHQFFQELDDLTVQPDAFPLYRALRDCHLVLSQGAHNQYGEMAVAARAEFLVMQSILAEPQMREFLGGRPMTPYPEPWMDRVDTMKSIQGWTDTSIMHFHDLATLGEQLVLTIRLGNWVEADAQDARGGRRLPSADPAVRGGLPLGHRRGPVAPRQRRAPGGAHPAPAHRRTPWRLSPGRPRRLTMAGPSDPGGRASPDGGVR